MGILPNHTAAMEGAFFETLVIGEIIKSYSNMGILDLPLYFYRDCDGNKIDLIIEDSKTFYSIIINIIINKFVFFSMQLICKGLAPIF